MTTLHRPHHQLNVLASTMIVLILMVLSVLALGVMAQLPASIVGGLDPLPMPQPSHVSLEGGSIGAR